MIIEIFDTDNYSVLLPTLKDILLLLPESNKQLVWSILASEVIRKDNGTINISELAGKIYTWNQLLNIANDIFQEINIIIVGCHNEKLIPRLGVDKDYYTPCEIVIEGIDTTLWRLYAKNAQDLSEIRKTYQKIDIVKK